MKETTVLSFKVAASSDTTVLEVDPNMNQDADGNAKSSFDPGERVYLSLHYDRSKYRLKDFYATTGEINYFGPQMGRRVIEQQFLQETTTSLQYIISGINKVTWYGPAKVLTYSYNNITVSEVPCIVDLDILIMTNIYVYIPDEYVSLDTTDSFPVGVVFNLEEI